jgi:hypothetical protein
VVFSIATPAVIKRVVQPVSVQQTKLIDHQAGLDKSCERTDHDCADHNIALKKLQMVGGVINPARFTAPVNQVQRLTSGQSVAAVSIVQRPDASMTATKATLPSPPRTQKLGTVAAAKIRGKAA